MRKLISVITAMIALQANAQNVGIGTTTPSDKLQVHGGTAATTNLTITNDASGTTAADGMHLGLIYLNGNTNFQYGQLSLAKKLPFLIRQIDDNDISRTRFTLDADGQFGLGSFSSNGVRLAVNGPTAIFPGLAQPAYLMLADTVVNSGLPAGISIQKKSASGNHFTIVSQDATRALSVLQANFKNGAANPRSVRLQFDSSGNVGIGDVTGTQLPALSSNLHVFGNQRLEGTDSREARFMLHSKEADYTTGSRISFHYSPSPFITPPAFGVNGSEYYLRLNDGNGSADIAKTFAIGVQRFQNGVFPGSDKVGLTVSPTGRVGIRKYPVSTDEATVQVDIEGATRINGGFTLTGIGEASGKLLMSGASGNASWQNPPKITLDQASASGQSAVEFRNQGGYVGSFGWSEASLRYFLFDGNTNTNPLVVKDGRVGMGDRNPTTNMLEVNGNASKSSAGDWLANSDARLKKNIVPISGALNKLQQLQGVTYLWNDDKTGISRPTDAQMGFTAQNIQQVFPELVSKDAQGYLQTGYGTYDALYVEAIKELIKKVEVLEEKIKKLEQK